MHHRTLLLLAFVLPSFSQAQVFKEGQSALSFGYGVGSFIGALNASFESYADINTSTLGPIFFKYEYGITEELGLGVNVAYGTNSWQYRYNSLDANGADVTYTETTERVHYSVLARLNYHFGSEEKFDPYFGVGLGYRNAIWSTESTDPFGTSGVSLRGFFPLGMELTIGARYFFTENIGLYAELGAAKTVVQGGLAVKF
jgi:opacity protein-like surface antigen